MRTSTQQLSLLEDELSSAVSDAASSTFINNMSLPVHRWFRYSAGFSAAWAESLIRTESADRRIRVLDPFVGSGTTMLAAEAVGAESWGVEAHPFISRIAGAKLSWRSSADAFKARATDVRRRMAKMNANLSRYPSLIRTCYDDRNLEKLDAIRQAYETLRDDAPASELVWLALVTSLRRSAKVGTAQWQYVLPSKTKKTRVNAVDVFDEAVNMIQTDMLSHAAAGPQGRLLQSDARTCQGIPDGTIDLVVTSPPYPNNYDYADATRLEMSFMGEISGWGDLQQSVRQHLIRSCSQHVPEKTIDLAEVLRSPELGPIVDELGSVCEELAVVRQSKGGRKTYHLMVACYFKDLALTWLSLSRVCSRKARACFVVGDSAPYGVYVPVIPWLGKLAEAAGFSSWRFEKTRDRNTKWKNRKHRVPLQEGRLWVER